MALYPNKPPYYSYPSIRYSGFPDAQIIHWEIKDSGETEDFTDLVSAIDFQLFRLNLIQLYLLTAKIIEETDESIWKR